jgi:hypothetical protein
LAALQLGFRNKPWPFRRIVELIFCRVKLGR